MIGHSIIDRFWEDVSGVTEVKEPYKSNPVKLYNTTSSTSPTTGSFIVAGGIGVGESIHVNTNLNVGNKIFLNDAVGHNSSVLNIRGDGSNTNQSFTAANIQFGSGKIGNGGQFRAMRLEWLGTGTDPDITGFEWVQSLFSHECKNTYGVNIALTSVNDEAGSVETYRGGSFQIEVNSNSTQAHSIYGVYAVGRDVGTNPNSTSFGIYATASSAAGTAWAAHLDGDVKVSGSVLNVANLPTSSAGLNAGDIWNNSGVLSIA